ncbi:MAG: ADP compounds hydrolase NudE [Gammaproteobacteria bacterium]|nr:ADP compounds hydrolase NudE [Gammaproteobacteria bacterium]
MPEKPKILDIQSLTKTRLFQIEKLQLEFSNGTQCYYERIIAASNGAVLIVPLLSNETVLMIKEYSVGTEQYELLFPKGLIDNNESIHDAANRELMEEVGYAARKLTHLKSMSIAPGYLGFQTHIVLAEDLYKQELPGDEPEPLQTVECHLNQIDTLLQRTDLTESRSIAALYMARDIIHKRNAND